MSAAKAAEKKPPAKRAPSPRRGKPSPVPAHAPTGDPAEDVARFRDRIVGLVRMPANEVERHPSNWRTHPDEQKGVIEWILRESGFAGAILTYPGPNGKPRAVNGHARLDVMGSRPVPVLLTNLSEAEADLVLATFDRIAEMAGADPSRLHALLAGFRGGNAAVGNALAMLAARAAPPRVEFPKFDESCADAVVFAKCPGCGHEFPR